MIKGDSTEYEILKEACQTLEGDDLFTAEIGVRQGQGSKIILDELISKKHWHIGIDPYGNLDYQHYDKSESYVCDYTNEMKHQLIKDLDYKNFSLLQMGDDEFMNRFSDGVPIYRDKKELRNKYDLVHFDGPHKSVDVIKESIFFGERSHAGTVFVYDDYPKYDMPLIQKIMEKYGFKVLEKGKNKVCLEKNES